MWQEHVYYRITLPQSTWIFQKQIRNVLFRSFCKFTNEKNIAFDDENDDDYNKFIWDTKVLGIHDTKVNLKQSGSKTFVMQNSIFPSYYIRANTLSLICLSEKKGMERKMSNWNWRDKLYYPLTTKTTLYYQQHLLNSNNCIFLQAGWRLCISQAVTLGTQ